MRGVDLSITMDVNMLNSLTKIALLMVLLLGSANYALAYDLEQFFHIYPGTSEYLIAYNCAIDSTTGKRYTVFPIPPIDARITNIGDVHYDSEGRATVVITANEPANITFGTFEYGCRLVGQ